MRASIRAGLALLLAAGVAAEARGQAGGGRGEGTRETVRGVIAGVTAVGETAIDYASRKAQTVEMSQLTVVGSPGPVRGAAGDRGGGAGRRRHNVYVLTLTPRTEFRDATATGGGTAGEVTGGTVRTTLDKVEVGDQVEVTFLRREFSAANGGGRHVEWSKKHGRHRTFFGDALTLTVLAEPARAGDLDAKGALPKDHDRDDDKDKVKDRDR